MAIWNTENEDKDYLVASKTSTFTCEKCGKGPFTSKWNLERHEAESHTNVRWECDECDKSFSRKATLKSHKIKVHKN